MTDNVCQDELNKFNQAASGWWDKSGDFAALHAINPLRMQFIESNVTLRDKHILDVGCGGGILSEALCKAGAKVTAIDMAKEALAVAKLHKLESELDIDYQLSSAEAFATSHDAHFDVITCLELLEHVPNPESVIAALATMLKPGGSLFLSTLNRNAKSFLLGIVGAEYILNLVPKGTHTYSKFIKPSECIAWCRTHNLSADDIKGITYNPLSKEYSLGSDIDVNYMVVFSKS